MQVDHYVTLHLTATQVEVIPAMQGDGARCLLASLMANGEPWPVPEGANVGIAYTLPDKSDGYYDQLTDGSPAATVAGNLVSVILAPALTAQAGTAKLSLVLRQGEQQTATFPLQLKVQAAVGKVLGEDVPVQQDGFEGRLYYGGPGGTIIPLVPGAGVEVVQQEDGTFVLVARGGSDGAGSWGELKGKPVYMQGEQEKFDPAWLPDGGFGWAETGEATVEWDGSTEGLDVVAVGGDYTLVRVSELLPSVEAMIGRTVEMADGSSFEVSTETIEWNGLVWAVLGPVGEDILPVLYGVGATEIDGITFPDTGLYAVLYPDQPYRFARVTIDYEMVHRLDSKYLPKEIVQEYVIELDYSKTVVTSSDKDVLVGKIPNDLRYTEIRDAYALGQRLVVRLKNTDYPETYLRLSDAGDREWRFETDAGSQYTADRIRKLYLTLINQDVSSDTVTARVAYINIELGGGAEQVQADLSQNDPEAPDYVKGRTHWEENNQTVIEWDDNTEGRDSFEFSGATFYKVSDLVPQEDTVVGGTLAFSSGESMSVGTDTIVAGEGGYIIFEPAIVMKSTKATIADIPIEAPSTGIYFVSYGASEYTSSLTYGSTIVHPLDEKWIPDSIARKTDIPKLDATLTKSGAAADAKATGDALNKKLDETALDGAIQDALAQATESGEFDGKPGEDGKTPVKGVDYFTEDEITEVARQAAGLVEVPEGGGSSAKWKRIGIFTAADNINPWIINADEDGKEFSCTEFRIRAKLCWFQLATNSTINRSIEFYGDDGNWYYINLTHVPGGFAAVVKGENASDVTATFKHPAVIDVTTHCGLLVAETIGESANNPTDAMTGVVCRNRGVRHGAARFSQIRISLGYPTNLVMAGSTVEIWGR